MPLIDCRPLDAYIDAHIVGAVSIPADSLGQRLYEMPSKDSPIRLAGDAQSLNAAVAFLAIKGYRIAETIELNNATLQQLQEAGQLEYGHSLYRAWQPCPLLQQWPDLAESWNIQPGKGLDLACGTGRDAVFLALQGWEMTAIDYLPRSLNKAAMLAKRNRTDICLKLMDIEVDDIGILSEQFDLIIIARYLHRPLLAKLSGLLKPGGVLLYQTFMQDAKRWGSPKGEQHLLADNELAGHFSPLTILRDTIDYLPDGRPVSSFIAQKTA